MHRFAAAAVALVALGSVAHANVEIGGTAGAHVFSDKSALGFVPATADTEGNSVLFGVRLGYYLNDALGIEVEGGMIPAEPRMLVFDIFNITARAGVVYQFRNEQSDSTLLPFVSAGAGLIQVVSSTNTDYIKKDSQPFGSLGVGAKYKTSGGWGVRFDLRANLGKANSASSGIALDFEALASLYKEFGRKEAPLKKSSEPAKGKEEDPDGDGIVGAADKCPKEAEDKDGFQDEDGCPDPDNDGDGIADDKDKCPLQAEDKDGFQDDDGCPDPDNDNDGIPDAADKCPLEAETKNGFQDDDGCPDEIPDALKSQLGVLAGVTFKGTTADLAGATIASLDKVAAAMAEVKDVKIEIGVHTDDQAPPKGSKFADNAALSQARADAVKAYLVKKGVDEGRLVAKGYGDTAPTEDPKDLKGAKLTAARTKNRRVELKVVAPEAAPAPAPVTAPAAPDAK